MSSDKQAFSNQENFNAYFYTLVSIDTDEMKFADARQQYLVDQGYFFEIIEELPFLKNPEQLEKITLNKTELCLSDKTE